MALALFDLDNTLLNGDSDHAWGLYLAEIGAVDQRAQQKKQDYFYQQYVEGTLNIIEFLNFQLSPLKDNPIELLLQWREGFLKTIIQTMIDTGKPELIDKHRAQKDELVIITATNDFITRPIADKLNISTLIATQAEIVAKQYTGKVTGTPCFQHGKVTRLQEWMNDKSCSLNDSWFYSDSINDLPLLSLVSNPVAVTPDDKLRTHAKKYDWPIID